MSDMNDQCRKITQISLSCENRDRKSTRFSYS